MLFSPEEIAKMEKTGTWLEALPKDWAPSKTPRGMMYMEYFSNPVKTAISEAMGQAQAAYIKASVKDGHSFIKTMDSVNKATDMMIKKSKEIFNQIGERKGAIIGTGVKNIVHSQEKQEKMIAQVRELRANPDKFIAKLGQSTDDIQNLSPKAAISLHASAARAVNYLAQNAPETKSQFPLGQDPIPSKQELRIFSEKIHVLDNPMIVFDEIKNHTLTPDHIEAIATVYPKLYQEMKTHIVDGLSDAIAKKQQIPYQTKNMLSLFLNQDLDESITSLAIAGNQSAWKTASHMNNVERQQASGNIRPTQKGLGNIEASTQMMTAMQKSNQRIDRG